MSMKRKRNQMDKVCDMCGKTGYANKLVACNNCKKTSRHIYCMNDQLFEVPMLWHCEDCPQSIDAIQIQTEATLNKKNIIVSGDSNFESSKGPMKKNFVRENNQIKASSPQANPANRRTTNDSTLVSNGKDEEKSILYQPNKVVSDVSKRSTFSKCVNRKQHVISGKNENTPKTKDYGTTVPSQKMELLQPRNSKEKMASCHAPQACWKGIFEILDGHFHLPPYQGLRAHLSCVINPKLGTICKSFPERIEFKEVPIINTLPKIFKLEPPDKDDVGLYFFCDLGRSKDKYIRLLERLDSRDHALKARMKDVQLLIFSSNQLPANFQKMKGEPYLWGIIRRPKPKVIPRNPKIKYSNNISTTSITNTSENAKTNATRLSPIKKAALNKKDNTKKDLPKLSPIQKIHLNQRTSTETGVSKPNPVTKVPLNQRDNTKKDVPKLNYVDKIQRENVKTAVPKSSPVEKIHMNKVDNTIDSDIPPGFSKQQLNVRLDTKLDKGNLVMYKAVNNKVANMTDTDVPPGSSKTLPPGILAPLDSPLSNDNVAISIDPDIPPGFSKISGVGISPGSLKTKSIKSSSKIVANLIDPDVPTGFSELMSPGFSELQILNCNKCTEPGIPLHIKTEKVDLSIDNEIMETEKSDMSISDEIIETEKVDKPIDNEVSKKDVLIPNIGPPPGFSEPLAKNSFVKFSDVAPGISEPLGSTKFTDFIQGARKSNCLAESNEKVINKDIIKSDVLIPIGPPPGFPELCRRKIDVVKCCFVESPLNKNEASLVCTQATNRTITSSQSIEEKKSSRSFSLLDQCVKNLSISKDLFFSSSPLSVKKEGNCTSVGILPTLNTQNSRETKSTSINLEPVSEVKRILLENRKDKRAIEKVQPVNSLTISAAQRSASENVINISSQKIPEEANEDNEQVSGSKASPIKISEVTDELPRKKSELDKGNVRSSFVSAFYGSPTIFNISPSSATERVSN